ncbi:MAG: hypothetical protein K1X71_10190 [Pirellulales bacterium]|nr:hypothetical protein [Pirellulales bacterium]
MRKYLGHFLMIAVALGGGIAVGQAADDNNKAPPNSTSEPASAATQPASIADEPAASAVAPERVEAAGQAPVSQPSAATAENADASAANPATDAATETPTTNGAQADDATTFDSDLSARGAMPDSSTRAKSSQDNQWRYRMFHGRWWYWLPSKTWVVWNGSSWVPPDQLVTTRERTYIGNSGYYDGPYYTGYGYRSGYRPGPNYYYGPGSYYNYSPNGYYNFGPYTSGGYYNGTWGTGYRGYNYGPGFGGFNYGGLGAGMGGSTFGGGIGVGIGAGMGSF